MASENGEADSRKRPPPSSSPTDNVHANISRFLQRMYDPSITRGLESHLPPSDNDLIHVPWKLQLANKEDTDTKTTDASDDTTTACSQVYPSFNYLELRRIQNNDWATDKLKEGIRLAKEGKSARAEECYKEGLDLVPTHAALFVAYGALCANLARTAEAINKLEHALELDPSIPNAQNYLNAIRKQARTTPRQAGPVNRSETAMQDALMERSFYQDNRTSMSNSNEKYPLLYEEKVNDSRNGNDDKRSKRKHRRRKEKKRRSSRRDDRSRHRKSRSKRTQRRHHDFSSDESINDGSKSQRQHGRRHRRVSSSEEPHRHTHGRPSTDETSEESNRRRRRRKKHKHRRRESSSDSSDTSIDREYRKERRRESKQRRKDEKRSQRRPESRSSEYEGVVDQEDSN